MGRSAKWPVLIASVVILLLLGVLVYRSGDTMGCLRCEVAMGPVVKECPSCLGCPNCPGFDRSKGFPTGDKEIWTYRDGTVYKEGTWAHDALYRRAVCYYVQPGDCMHDINLCSVPEGTKICQGIELDDCKHDISLCPPGRTR